MAQGKAANSRVYKHSLIHIFENCFHSKQWLQSTFSCWQLVFFFFFFNSLCILYLPNGVGIDHTHENSADKTTLRIRLELT